MHLAYVTSLLNHLVSQVDECSLVRVYSEYAHKIHLVTNTRFWYECFKKFVTEGCYGVASLLSYAVIGEKPGAISHEGDGYGVAL